MTSEIITQRTKYEVQPTTLFSLCEESSFDTNFPKHDWEQKYNYIIDLPNNQWPETVVVNCVSRLHDGDQLKLPNGSWLEVTLDKESSFGYDGLLYAHLHLISPKTNDLERVEREINNKRKQRNVYKTIATYIR